MRKKGPHFFVDLPWEPALGETERGEMLALINRILDWFKSLFWKEEMELTLVGLQYSGKTTFVNVIAVSRGRGRREGCWVVNLKREGGDTKASDSCPA